MNNIEGQLDINLYPQRINGERVTLSSTRPLHVTKLFIGKTPDEALSIMPLLFSICGAAQCRASLSAMQQNMSIDRQHDLEIARDMLVLVENTKEHLFRIFIDWPKLLCLQNKTKNLVYLSQMLNDFKTTLFTNADAFALNSQLSTDYKNADYLIDKLEQYLEENVFSAPLDIWLNIHNHSALQSWAANANTIAANSIQKIYAKNWDATGLTDSQPLPDLDEKKLFEAFNADNAEQFIAQPTWQDDCCETTCLTRQRHQPLIKNLYAKSNNSLITRWAARLVELANIPQQLRTLLQQLNQAHEYAVHIVSPQNNIGLAQVEAARGRLIHRVNIENNIITHYQILAPTEWNFHPQGLLSKSLSSLMDNNTNDLEALSHLMINAIDPCVGYQLRIH